MPLKLPPARQLFLALNQVVLGLQHVALGMKSILAGTLATLTTAAVLAPLL